MTWRIFALIRPRRNFLNVIIIQISNASVRQQTESIKLKTYTVGLLKSLIQSP